MIVKLVMGAILALGLTYVCTLIPELRRHRAELAAEPGKNWQLGGITFLIQAIATLGVSDFAMSTPIYRGMKLVDDGRLPGTLVTACAVPMTCISLLYISSNPIEPWTLLLCVLFQAAGSVVGVRLVSRLRADVIRRVMGIAITASAAIMLVRMLGFLGGSGSLNGFSVGMLCWMLPVVFLLGALNMIGFGVKAPLMALYLTMGLSPLCVLPLVMSGCCCGSISGAIGYVRSGKYQRRIAAVSAVCGTVGVFVGAQFVERMDITVLQWIMFGIMIYTAWTMLRRPKPARS